MVIIKIKGGMGNQLFTYACGYAIARERGDVLVLDDHIYNSFYALRNYELIHFPLTTKEMFMPKFNCISSSGNIIKVKRKIYDTLHYIKSQIVLKAEYIEEKEQFSLQTFPNIEEKENILLDGYWQNYRYFEKYKNEIIPQFIPNVKQSDSMNRIIDWIECNDVIAIHIRRGDYKNLWGGSFLSDDYYSLAIAIMRKLVGNNATILVFSDDLSESKEILKSVQNVKYIKELGSYDDIEEFYIMIHCEHFIIANSTYSWWPAYLSSGTNKHVIAPVVGIWKSDFYPDDWIKIEAETV